MATKIVWAPWARLPNAQHIDAVLAGIFASSEVWDAAHAAVSDLIMAPGKPYNRSWDAAHSAANQCRRKDILLSLVNLRDSRASLSGTLPAVAALIAWDSSADLLECTPDVLRTMIDLAEPPVCHQAALLLPYAIVRFGTWP
jgi:hypothetical protein